MSDQNVPVVKAISSETIVHPDGRQDVVVKVSVIDLAKKVGVAQASRITGIAANRFPSNLPK